MMCQLFVFLTVLHESDSTVINDYTTMGQLVFYCSYLNLNFQPVRFLIRPLSQLCA